MTLPTGWSSRLFTSKPYSSGRYEVSVYDAQRRYVGAYQFLGHDQPYDQKFSVRGVRYPTPEAAIAAVLDGAR